jgi:Flp pilus assembly protein TadD
MRIRQNLALAIGLQGRVPEAESIVSAGLPPDEAAESVSTLKQMLPRGDQPTPRRARSAETGSASRS